MFLLSTFSPPLLFPQGCFADPPQRDPSRGYSAGCLSGIAEWWVLKYSVNLDLGYKGRRAVVIILGLSRAVAVFWMTPCWPCLHFTLLWVCVSAPSFPPFIAILSLYTPDFLNIRLLSWNLLCIVQKSAVLDRLSKTLDEVYPVQTAWKAFG